MTLKSSELLVERSKVALFLNLLTRCGLTLQHRKDNGVELATELVLIEHLFEVFGNEFGFKLEHATSDNTLSSNSWDSGYWKTSPTLKGRDEGEREE